MGTFDLAHGLLFGLFGLLLTICGFMIAYIVAWKSYEKAIHKTKRKPHPLDDLNKNMPGRYGEDCQ
jgi:hypothetical protein|tara:strand:+ start:174 stop:371 length:198 start_codon:yes stop_codon:yes gene_type:complete